MARSSLKLAAQTAVAALLASAGFCPRAFADAYSTAVTGTSGLVGYWELNDTDVNGNYVDSSPSGNIGVPGGNVLTNVDGPRPSDGLAGFDSGNQAAGFDFTDGGSEAIEIADPNSVLNAHTGDLTYSVWFKGPNDGQDYFLLSKQNSTRNGYSLERLNGVGSLNVSMSPDDNTPAIGPLGPKSDETHWANAVVVLHRNRTSASSDYTSSGASIFVNGVWYAVQDSASFDGSPGIDSANTLPLIIGAFRESHDGWLDSYTGSIDDVSVFNRALSPVEVQQLYNVASTGTAGVAHPIWKSAGGGNWSDSSNWLVGVPSGVDATANLTSALAAGSTVTLDTPFTVGTLNFASINRYTIGGPGTLTISSTTTGAINMINGNQTISTTLNLQSNTILTISPSGNQMTLSGQVVSAPGVTLTKMGAGSVLFNQGIRTSGLDVEQGVMRAVAGTISINESGRASVLNTINIGTLSGAYIARFDLGNNSAIVDYSGVSPIATIGGMLKQGFANGAWNGFGIASNTASGVAGDGTKLHKTALGYAEAGALGIGSFAGQTLSDNTAILIAYTVYGDANLDGTVNALDFNALAANYGHTSAAWYQGDYNYDGIVNTSDFSLLANNFGQTAGLVASGAQLGSLVPEPASLGIAALLAPFALRRKRSRQRAS